jgi:ABC-type bacteriocin/lantibiotic exporter with double-glycine peptidase domain
MPLYETEITRVPDAHKMSKEEEAYGQLEDEETHVDIPVQQEPPRKTSNAKTDEEKEKEKRENVFAQMKNIKNMNMGQIKWLLTLAKAEIWLLILGSIMLIVSSAANLVIPQYIGAMIDSVTQEEDYLGRMVLTLFIVVLIMGITGAIRAYCYQVAGERVVARLRKTLFETIVVQEVAFFDMTKTGELLNRLSSDTVSTAYIH